MNRFARWHPLRVGIVAAVTLGLLVGASPALAKTRITGTGASAPAPLYQLWTHHYGAATVQYLSANSGTGISQIEHKTVNFGASDKPLAPSDLSKNSLVQFPSCIEGVVPVVNIHGVASGRLKLTGSVLSLIFRGKITKWSDKRITSLNKGLKLSGAITVVHRSDASGTTWIYTHYLKSVDSAWPFADMSGRWPVGVGMPKSSGVANEVKAKTGAIGYVEISWALTAHIPYVQMKNRSGKWVLPSERTFAAAGSHARYTWSNGFATSLVNMKGAAVWPITGETYILVQRKQPSYAMGHAMLSFFNWTTANSRGVSDAKALDFVPLPKAATTAIHKVWHSYVKAGSKPCW